jgi:hypothetical protein
VRDALADALLGADKTDRQVFRVGTVTSTSPTEVSIAGGTSLSAAHLAAYTPVNADVVLVLQTDSDLCIMGQIVSGG